MRILFVNTHLAERARQGEGSSAHFLGVGRGILRLGHDVLLPSREAKHFAAVTASVSPWFPLSARAVDFIYVRMEGWPVRMPWYISRSTRRRLFAPEAKVVWEINAAPELTVFDGRNLSPSRLLELEAVLQNQARSVDLAICNTQGLCRFALDLGIPRARHIELATFPDAFRPNRHESDCLEVCWVVGNAKVVWHDVATVFRAAALVLSSERIRFHIIGDVILSTVPTNITLHGKLAHRKLAKLLTRMDVGIAMYRPDSWSRYGVFSSPLKIFDYLAAGLHVVVSPIEQAHYLKRLGVGMDIIPFEDAAALARCLMAIKKDQQFRDRCSQNAALCQRHYNWGRVAQETADALSDIL
jgi:glycosyltransferase involved in cell wall biosynthesis